MSRFWHTPIRITKTKTLAWFKTGTIDVRSKLPVYVLCDPATRKGAALSFPMKGGYAKGCVQDMDTPQEFK